MVCNSLALVQIIAVCVYRVLSFLYFCMFHIKIHITVGIAVLTLITHALVQPAVNATEILCCCYSPTCIKHMRCRDFENDLSNEGQINTEVLRSCVKYTL